MHIKTFSSREFNQDVSKAKRAAVHAPIIITDRGKASYVLLSIEEYRKITGQEKSIVDLLAMSDEIEFEPERLSDQLFKTVDLS